MGRGRAKAKQTKVARALKYSTTATDLERLQRELAASRGEPYIPGPGAQAEADPDAEFDSAQFDSAQFDPEDLPVEPDEDAWLPDR